ncbi:MAG: glucose 1-dehydrogenase [Acidimicrobiales bacterium]|nr:glucose 1-dehydrogenase [Acidimicrobiales bacterium]
MILDSFRLDQRVAIVTAASSGIGARTAIALAEVGASVVVGARRADALADVVEQIEAVGGQALPVAGSLADRDGMATLVDRTVAEFGGIDIVVNNAGGSMPRAFPDETEQAFEQAFHWNVTTAFNLTQLALPHLLERPGASVVNMASVAGQHASRGFAAYGTAKAAMIKLTKHLAADLAPKVRVNAVAPGAIRTPALEGVLNDDLEKAMADGTPMKRIGEVDDIAAAVLYLASPAAGYVTGECLAVSGGIQGSNLEMGIPDL